MFCNKSSQNEDVCIAGKAKQELRLITNPLNYCRNREEADRKANAEGEKRRPAEDEEKLQGKRRKEGMHRVGGTIK